MSVFILALRSHVTWIMMLAVTLCWQETPLATGEKKRGITFLLTYFCNRIFVFFFVALCLPASLTDLFVCLTHHGIAILMTSLTIPSTILWQWNEQPADPIHRKINLLLDGNHDRLFNRTHVSNLCHLKHQQSNRSTYSLHQRCRRIS